MSDILRGSLLQGAALQAIVRGGLLIATLREEGSAPPFGGLFYNGDFADGTSGWSPGTGSTSLSVSGGILTATKNTVPNSDWIYFSHDEPIALIGGQTYRISWTDYSQSGVATNLWIGVGSVVGGADVLTTTNMGTAASGSIEFTPGGNISAYVTFYGQVTADTAATITLDNLEMVVV